MTNCEREHEDDADNDWRFQIEVQEPLSGNRDQEDEFDDPLDRPLSPLHLEYVLPSVLLRPFTHPELSQPIAYWHTYVPIDTKATSA